MLIEDTGFNVSNKLCPHSQGIEIMNISINHLPYTSYVYTRALTYLDYLAAITNESVQVLLRESMVNLEQREENLQVCHNLN